MKTTRKVKNSSVLSPVAARNKRTKTSSPKNTSVKYKQAHYLAISKLSKSDNSEVDAMKKSNNRILHGTNK